MQAILSILVVAEVPVWLRYGKPFRFFSLFISAISNCIYAGFFIDWLYKSFFYNKPDFSLFDIIEQFMAIFNLIFHSPIPIINISIQLKEISLEFFHFYNTRLNQDPVKKARLSKIDMALGISDLIWAFRRIWEFPIKMIK